MECLIVSDRGVPDRDQIIANAQTAVDHPVFVIGTMRSGTGFLGLCLDESPDLIGCPFELRRIWNQVGKVPMASDKEGKSCPYCGPQHLSVTEEEALKAAFAGEVIKNIKEKPWSSRLRFLNKNPHLCNKIELVDLLFPKASYIWTIRNLKDVVCSLKNLFERDGMRARGIRHRWPEKDPDNRYRCFDVLHKDDPDTGSPGHIFPGGDVYFLAEYWLESNLSLLRFFQRKNRANMCVVSHDKVMTHPNLVSEELESVLFLPKNALAHITERINPEEVQQWATNLNTSEMAQIKKFEIEHQVVLSEIERFVNQPMTA